MIKSLGYTIYVGEKVFKDLSSFLKKQKHSNYFILCDENTIKNCLPTLVVQCKELKDAEIFEIESGENSKNLQLCSQLWEALLGYNADKNALIINLGGGVVSDLGGFIASVYKRGIDFINIPTSLLAMADASVGGKTGIDFLGLKNVIGTITQPKGVFVYPEFLETLPQRHIANGMAEIYKMALISDKILWMKLQTAKILDDEFITKSVALKNNFVKKDPSDKGIRKALNFGHTVGHAIESVLLASEVDILHGEAVLAGMICESKISLKKKLISKKEFDEIVNTLTTKFTFAPLPSLLFGEMVKATINDKKNTCSGLSRNNKLQIQCALLNGIGKNKINVPVAPMEILESLEFYNSITS
ncbi:MAG TPA: 3-dehydroquinate synthase [Bacteroidia bacterium]|jgi:3-dehydroquinate synthase|nr:3-dehydroquinate synthase [Bacteroidia bacterium]